MKDFPETVRSTDSQHEAGALYHIPTRYHVMHWADLDTHIALENDAPFRHIEAT